LSKILSLRLPFLRAWITKDPGESLTPGSFMFSTNLTVRHIRDGEVIKEIDMGSGIVTLAGVTLMAADASNATATLKQAIYHDSGSGTSAVDIGQVALQAPLTGLQVGGRTAASASNILNTYISTASIQYSSSATVGEWGLFTAAAGGTMWDRKVLSPLFAVLINDQLQFIYKLTIVPGG
jgi:hypothetical protein